MNDFFMGSDFFSSFVRSPSCVGVVIWLNGSSV